MNNVELKYFVRGSAFPKVWGQYETVEEARKDAQALMRVSNVTRCQIFEWVAVAEALEAQAA